MKVALQARNQEATARKKLLAELLTKMVALALLLAEMTASVFAYLQSLSLPHQTQTALLSLADILAVHVQLTVEPEPVLLTSPELEQLLIMSS